MLYARLLGSSWAALAEPIRLAHATESAVHARGRLRIAHGDSRAARVLARVMRLPRASDAAETRLTVTPRGGEEHWCRTFDDRRLDTRQYEAGDGQLAERFGLLEFRFRLEASDGSLLFRQIEAALMFGSVRVRLPAACAPRVDALEEPAGARQVRIRVRVALPALGPVLTYDGVMLIEETRP